MPSRYVVLAPNLFFDTETQTIVKKIGDRYVFVRHDRRSKSSTSGSIAPKTRRKDDKIAGDFYSLGAGLFFDKNEKLIYKKNASGDFILYSKDRRKKDISVVNDRRKSS